MTEPRRITEREVDLAMGLPDASTFSLTAESFRDTQRITSMVYTAARRAGVVVRCKVRPIRNGGWTVQVTVER